MLLDAINNLPDGKRYDELVLFSDGCPGQNKNKTILGRVSLLLSPRAETFLSYLPNDQDFSLIGKKKKSTMKVEIPEMCDKIVEEARKHPSSFHLKIMTHEDFIDMKNAVEPFFLKTPKPLMKLYDFVIKLFCRRKKYYN